MDQLDLQSALHILVNADMRLAAAVIERPGTQLIDIAVVMLQDTLHGRGGTSFPADNLSPHGTEPACNSGQTGSIHRICGGSLPSSHPLSMGDVVVLSLSANRANGISLAAR